MSDKEWSVGDACYFLHRLSADYYSIYNGKVEGMRTGVLSVLTDWGTSFRVSRSNAFHNAIAAEIGRRKLELRYAVDKLDRKSAQLERACTRCAALAGEVDVLKKDVSRLRKSMCMEDSVDGGNELPKREEN